MHSNTGWKLSLRDSLSGLHSGQLALHNNHWLADGLTNFPDLFINNFDLSYPEGASVKDFIPQEISSGQYATIQDAIPFIKTSPYTILLSKVDIVWAFHIIPRLCWVFSGRVYATWMWSF